MSGSPEKTIPLQQSIDEPSARLHADDLVPSLPPTENKRFYPALDGLRAIAVLMVFYQHYLYGNRAWMNWGWAGVDVFFVLSGFLITGILYDTRHTVHRFRNFYVRRTLRIFPLYYGVLLLALALTPIFHWIWHPAWYLWPLYLGNYARFIWLPDWLQGLGTLDHLRSSLPHTPPYFLYLGHFWSLCVEEQFYLIWPLMVFLVKDRIRLRNICLVISVLSLAARIACWYLVPQPYLNAELLYRLTPLRADALLLGGMFALMMRGPEAAWLARAVKPVLYSFLLGFACLQMFSLLSSHHLYYPGGPFLSTIGYTLLDLFSGAVILRSLVPQSRLYRFFTLTPLRRLGQMSYGFYVWHDIPHVEYGMVTHHFLHTDSTFHSTAALAFCSTVVLSYLSYRFFEAPFLRLKDRFTVGS